jgi:hypothetical protein
MLRNKAWLRWGVAALATTTLATAAIAADHLDGPAVTADAAADITDTYAWVDNGKIILVMNVFPLAGKDAAFSDKVAYVLHTESTSGFGVPGKALDIICTFDAAKKASCWIGNKDYVTGDASVADGITSSSGKVKVFAGLRDDPFFFNLEGFKDTVSTVVAAAPTLTFDKAGCPAVDAATSGALVNMLKSTGKGTMPAADFFAGKNVLSIVLQIDATLLNEGGTVMSVWGSTNQVGG